MKKLVQMPQFTYSFSGHTLDILCRSTDTILEVKREIINKHLAKDNINENQIQGIYSGFFLLQDHLKVDQCLEEDQTVSLKLKKAKQIEYWEDGSKRARVNWGKVVSTPPIKRVVTIFESEKEMFLHHGTSENFQSLLLKPERENKVKLKSKKFGIAIEKNFKER